MSIETIAEILRAYLKQEGLVLCRHADTTFALDGVRETATLRELVLLVDDAQRIDEWDALPTSQIDRQLVNRLRAESKGTAHQVPRPIPAPRQVREARGKAQGK